MSRKEEDFLQSLVEENANNRGCEELKAKEEQLRRVKQNYSKIKQRLRKMVKRFKEVGLLRKKLEDEIMVLREGAESTSSNSEKKDENDGYEMDFWSNWCHQNSAVELVSSSYASAVKGPSVDEDGPSIPNRYPDEAC